MTPALQNNDGLIIGIVAAVMVVAVLIALYFIVFKKKIAGASARKKELNAKKQAQKEAQQDVVSSVFGARDREPSREELLQAEANRKQKEINQRNAQIASAFAEAKAKTNMSDFELRNTMSAGMFVQQNLDSIIAPPSFEKEQGALGVSVMTQFSGDNMASNAALKEKKTVNIEESTTKAFEDMNALTGFGATTAAEAGKKTVKIEKTKKANAQKAIDMKRFNSIDTYGSAGITSKGKKQFEDENVEGGE
jgi:hypothetical protein